MSTPNVTLTFAPVASATRYEIAIESLGASGFTAYFTYTTTTPSKTFWPATRGTTYRFRVRATVGGTVRAWSAYATFDVS